MECGKGNGSLPLRSSLHFLAAESQMTKSKLLEKSQVWSHTPLIPVLRGQRKKDLYEFRVSLVNRTAEFQDSQGYTNPISKNRQKHSLQRQYS